MKKLMFAFCFMLGAATAVNAQDTTATQQGEPQYQTQGDENLGRQSITASELPEAARQTLESQDYSGYTVNNAFKKVKDNGEVEYSVKLKSGSDTKKITFDADGNKIKEKGKDKNKDKDTDSDQ